MKKSVFWSVIFITAVFSVNAVYGQGFTGIGPGSGTNAQIQTVTASQVKNLREGSLVILTGNIVNSLGREKFTFRDSTGDVTIEIDRNLWVLLDLSVSANDSVEIRGEIEIQNRNAVVDVLYLKKLQSK
ncbi:MAG: NirD/YgiW/YdeI family stress tolerance protein [Treponema sp.]|jgi:uncharacterized protein (TIGR00156 family)|nr:NirD/YgiW/YdeI family stress tolerance protein [Treponema sp.]